MNEERLHRALGCLLRAGLWEQPEWEEGVFPLAEAEWGALFRLACRQTVQGVVFEGIRKLPEAWCPPRKVLAMWLLAVEQLAKEHARVEARMLEQAAWWKQRGITAIVLKGQGVAAMYPVPERRVCGDIDWYFPNRQEWSAASRIAEEKGCTVETDSDGDMHYMYIDTLTEHHRHWEHLSNPFQKRRLKRLEEAEGYADWRGIKVLAPIPDLVQLNTHILKHALVLGIGLRQLCDLAMAYRHYAGSYDTAKLKEQLKRLGLWKWTALLHTVLVEVIGVPLSYLPFPLEKRVDIEPLVRQIWKDGNFGMHRDTEQAFQEKGRWERCKYLVAGIPEKMGLFVKYAPAEWCWRPIGLLKHRILNSFPKETGRQMAWVWRLSKPHQGAIAWSALIDLLGMGLSLVAIYFSKQAIDVATGSSEGHLWWNAGIMVACIIGSMLAGICNPWITERVYLKYQMRLQTLLNDRLMAASWKESQQWHTGDILNRLTKDCEEVVQLVVYTLPSVGVTLVKLLASFGFLCMLDTRIAWILLASTPLLLLSKVYYKRMRALSREWKTCDSRIVSVLQENMTARMLIASLGAEEVRKSLLEEEQANRYRVGMEQLKFSTYSKGVLRSVFNGGYFLAFLLGIYYLSKNLISFGTMIAFIQLVGRVQGPVLQLIGFVPGLIRVRASVERMMELDECGGGRKRREECVETAEALEVRKVHFGYQRRKVIEDLAVTVKPGEPLAVVGPTGAGKTTLIRLVAGILEPDRGSIVLKAEGQEWDTASLHRLNFVYVPQGNSLFSGTIRENLQLVDRSVSEERLKEVLDLACADFVWNLPSGLDTEIGEKGFGLSEGQAQRLAIARALLLPGVVWIFDEVTSALDAGTAKRLVRNLIDAGKEKIVLFVTHDAALKEQCAQVLSMERA